MTTLSTEIRERGKMWYRIKAWWRLYRLLKAIRNSTKEMNKLTQSMDKGRISIEEYMVAWDNLPEEDKEIIRHHGEYYP